MIEQITASSITLKDGHQIRSLPKCYAHLPLLPSTGTLSCLFWSYFQFTCILWKQVLTDMHTPNELLVRKLDHAIQVATVIYDQSPQDIQNCIIRKFSLSSDILLLCGRLAIAAIQGIANYP